jgi:hypothetical protein
MSSRVAAFLVAAALLLGSGAVHYSLATDSEQLDRASARVAEAPRVVGRWHARDEPTDDASFAQAGAKHYWMRTYTHQDTKASVLAILMCGRSGRMAVHTPEVCYRGAGYELHQDAAPFTLGGEAGQLWMARFTKKGVAPSELRLYWGWNARGQWEAPSSPRWRFRGEPFLYKLYVSRDITSSPGAAPDTDAEVDFLRQFVPALERTLFAS